MAESVQGQWCAFEKHGEQGKWRRWHGAEFLMRRTKRNREHRRGVCENDLTI